MEGNILANRSSEKRRAADYYQTPPDCTQALVDFLNIPKGATIWEPACGEGYMSRVLLENGYDVISTDVNRYGFENNVEDFLTSQGKTCDWIITNPPFALSEQFIRKCLEFEKPFALLLKSQYWHSKKRYPLFMEHPPTFVCPLTWRPDFEFGKRGGAPTMECIWTVWCREKTGVTLYVPLRKGE